MDEVLEFLKKYRKVCLTTVVLLVGLVVCLNISGGQKQRLRDVHAQTNQLESQLKVMQQKAAEKAESSVLPSGLNIMRLGDDRVVLNQFLSKLLTFKSWDEYEANRMMLMRDYQWNVNDEMLRIFYQATTEEPTNTDRYLHLKSPDDICELTMQQFVPYIIHIDGGEYTYLCDVTAVSKQQTYRFGLVCTVGPNQTVVSAQGYGLMPDS